jgi:hypothetical protein
MIFVDEIREYPSGQWCHMWSDASDYELDAFAVAALCLRTAWSHESYGASGRFYHYDLRPSKRKLALKRGAVFMPLTDWIKARLPEETRP